MLPSRAKPGALNGCIEYVGGRRGDCRRTVKPWDEAQTLVPWVLKMAALSRFPVPTKLPNLHQYPEERKMLSYVKVPGINICFDGSESARPRNETGRPTDLATTCLINSGASNAEDASDN